MKLKELLVKDNYGGYHGILQGRLIALDGVNGKVLFDTVINKSAYIELFMEREILSIWADVITRGANTFSVWTQPVIKCYLHHED